MIQIFRFKVDNISYEMSSYTGRKTVKLFSRLIKLASKPLGAALAALPNGIDTDLSKIPAIAISNTIEALSESIEENQTVETIESLLEGLQGTIDGVHRAVDFDIDFSSDIGHLFKVLTEIVKVQFGKSLNFLAEEAKGKIAALVKEKKNQVMKAM